MTEDAKSISQELREAVETFLKTASIILIKAQRLDDEASADRVAWSEERKAWSKERTLLRDAAIIAERREATVQRELTDSQEEIARLLAQLNIIEDATQRGQQGAKISRRLSDGLPGFSDAIEPSNAVPGAHRGEPYQSISSDIKESVRILESMEPKSAMDQAFHDEFGKALEASQ